jgi:hypothetical protein
MREDGTGLPFTMARFCAKTGDASSATKAALSMCFFIVKSSKRRRVK